MDFSQRLSALVSAVTSYGSRTKTKIETYVLMSLIGAANGVAPLVNGYIPAQFIPSFVDNCDEFDGVANFPAIGRKETVYIDTSSTFLKAYRWSGTGYFQINNSVGNADVAMRLAAARTITMTGDASWTTSFDGSANVTAVITLADVVTAGSGIKVTYNSKGLVTGSTGLAAADIPSLDAAKITTGTFGVALIPSLDTAKISTGIFAVARIPDLDASKVTSGMFAAARIPTLNQDTTGTATNATNATTAATANALNTANNYQVNSLGVGTAAPAVAGEIRATGNITGYYSDGRLKTVIGNIESALEKVLLLNGVVYTGNALAEKHGFDSSAKQIGVIAQEVNRVAPEVVTFAPFDIGRNEKGIEYSISGENYLTVRYERLAPLLIEAIKQLNSKVVELENKLNSKES